MRLSNSIALVKLQSPSEHLRFTCLFTVEHTGERALDLPLAPGAETYPFGIRGEDRVVRSTYLTPFYDADEALMAWARHFIRSDGPTQSRQLLVDMTRHIRDTMTYLPRDEEGVQSPGQTLARKSGSCRDFATLMIEAVRRLGYAARFVSGYVYTPEHAPGADMQAPSGRPMRGCRCTCRRRLDDLRPDQQPHRRHRPHPRRLRAPRQLRVTGQRHVGRGAGRLPGNEGPRVGGQARAGGRLTARVCAAEPRRLLAFGLCTAPPSPLREGAPA
jgi:hypothetical protein